MSRGWILQVLVKQFPSPEKAKAEFEKLLAARTSGCVTTMRSSRGSGSLTRPPKILDGDRSAPVRVALGHLAGTTITRGQVARFLLEHLDPTQYVQKAPCIAGRARGSPTMRAPSSPHSSLCALFL